MKRIANHDDEKTFALFFTNYTNTKHVHKVSIRYIRF